MAASLHTELVPPRPAPEGWPSDVPLPLTEDDLPHDDGETTDSTRHRAQMNLLVDALAWHWRDRADRMVEGNLGLYYIS